MNPFRYSDPVPVEELLNRDGEAEQLMRRAEEGNNSRLVAPRRFGKTSLLRRVIHDASCVDWATVYVDFFGVLTLGDVSQRIERAYADQLEGKLASWFAGVRQMLHPTLRAGGGPLPAGVEVTIDQQEPSLLERLALPRRLYERHGRRTLVVFDEFQDVLEAHDRIDAIIRSEIQHHGDAASYIFAGSHVGMMRELFADKRRAFYGQAAAVELPPLPADAVADYLATRFDQTNRDIGLALEPLLELAQGHPQRTMFLAHAVWEFTPSGQAATEATWNSAYRKVMDEARDELRALWVALATSQRRALATIAENTGSLYGAARPHGGSRGGAVRAAVQVLLDRGDIRHDSIAVTGYRVTDPLLAAWVIEGRPGT